ncbi:hypothetical protein EXIGLDRAFT_724065 [Exidia glandulosa HHB12029]|uniref:Uncharacterized protein n=1 Tax=Exidia glandulosa HHB12029 TaxID=1314781 RepID=A0A165EJY7_EXIGL|nr:hypothetical protein EXIGLDRAFT_724065 [Exidia glandulosa HHB12029]
MFLSRPTGRTAGSVACNGIDSVRGDPGKKGPMVLHLLGGQRSGDACKHASKAARAAARKVRGDDDAESESSDNATERAPKRKRTAVQNQVEINFTQGILPRIKGVDLPFSDSQTKAIEEQCARATVSANLPFRWIEDPEVIRLFLMMRTRALDVLPSSKVVGGRLLNEEGHRAEDNLRTVFRGKSVTLGFALI